MCYTIMTCSAWLTYDRARPVKSSITVVRLTCPFPATVTVTFRAVKRDNEIACGNWTSCQRALHCIERIIIGHVRSRSFIRAMHCPQYSQRGNRNQRQRAVLRTELVIAIPVNRFAQLGFWLSCDWRRRRPLFVAINLYRQLIYIGTPGFAVLHSSPSWPSVFNWFVYYVYLLVN